jgi:hypothetical protein
MTPRRFPPPWTIEEHNEACFIVKDATRQAIAYVYFEDEPGRRSAISISTMSHSAARRLTGSRATRRGARRRTSPRRRTNGRSDHDLLKGPQKHSISKR